LFMSIYKKHRHTVIYTPLGTIYAGLLNGRRGPEPYLKADHANGRTAHGRSCRWPRPRPLAAICGCLTASKNAQGRRRQDRATDAWRGSHPVAEMAAASVGGGVAIGLRRWGESVFELFRLCATSRYARVGEEKDAHGCRALFEQRHPKPKFGPRLQPGHFALGRWARYY
jgi:hypothetical protein